MKYRTTMHSTTGKTPSDLLYGRNIRTRLDLLKPSASHMTQESALSLFRSGSLVWYQDYKPSRKRWLPGLVIEPIGNCMFWVQDNQEPQLQVRCHQDQLHSRSILIYRQDVNLTSGTGFSIPFNLVPSSQNSQQPDSSADWSTGWSERHTKCHLKLYVRDS